MSRGVILNFDATAAIGFVLIYCVASLITVGGASGPVTGWGDDWAQYIMHARAITQGRAYSDIGYVWSIYAPLIGPPAYPPATAFVLAPFFLAFGYSMEIASFSMAACFGLFLLAFYAFLSRLGSRQIALATLVFVALNPVFWRNAQSVGSDNPYLMFCYFALLVATLREGAHGLLAILGYSVLLGILISLAYLTRDVGIILLFSVITVDLVRWRQLAARTLPMLAIFVLSAFWQSQLLASTKAYDYDQIVFSMLGTDILGNIVRFFNDFRFYAYLGGHLDAVTGGAFLMFSVVGCSQSLTPSVSELQRPARLVFTRLLSAARSVPLHFIFVTGNVLFLFLLPFDQGGRYLRPFAPILMWYAVIAASALTRLSGRPRVAGGCLALAVGVLTVGTYIINDNPRLGLQAPSSPEARALFAAVNRLVPKDEIVVFAKPRAMALFSGRKSIGWPSAVYSHWDEILAQQGLVDFVISNELSLPGEDKENIEDVRKRTKPIVMFQNNQFSLYHIEMPSN